MSAGDPPIIISGGSVTIDFNQSQFQANGRGRFHNPNKVIERVEVSGDGVNIDETFLTGKVVIKIYYGNP